MNFDPRRGRLEHVALDATRRRRSSTSSIGDRLCLGIPVIGGPAAHEDWRQRRGERRDIGWHVAGQNDQGRWRQDQMPPLDTPSPTPCENPTYTSAHWLRC